MKKYITLLVSCLTFFVPLLSRGEGLKQGIDNPQTQQSQQQQIEEILFLKLKRTIAPENFDGGTNYTGMKTAH